MTPLDFIKPEDLQFNDPVGDWNEALSKPITIHSNGRDWEVLSYYMHGRQMHLDIQEVKK